jgi:3-dehydroquinate synthase
MSERIAVELAQRRYEVHIGAGLLRDRNAWQAHVAGRRVLLVSDSHVAPLYADVLRPALAGAARIGCATIDAGEAGKTLDTCAQLFDRLAALGAGRDGLVIALGGGVIGDLAGFAAACWMRGIDFVQAPTTLLAMVDSSVGGKTGVNLPQGKNLVGAFHQPVAVIADTDTLATLPPRELAAGLAEVVKYAALGDAGFFDWLEANAPALAAGDATALRHAIAACVRHKAAIVARDEREGGERALLNLGHTFGHAIETATSYGRYLHGEAVAIGMVLAARLSARLGLAPAADAVRLQELLAALNLPTALPPVATPEALVALMRLDKKNHGGRLRLILWHGIGRARIVDGVDENVVLAELAESLDAADASR